MINTMGLTEIFSILDNLYEAEFIQRFVHEKKEIIRCDPQLDISVY